MKNNRFLVVLCMVFAAFASLSSCSDKDDKTSGGGTEHDPNLPVEVTGFMPELGGFRTKCIIKGKNFGTDKSKVKVFFAGDREATVIGLDGETIYCLAPKQETGNSSVAVEVNGKKIDVKDKVFAYTAVEQVSTVSGQTGTSGYIDGTLTEARFTYMTGVGALINNNLIISEGHPGNSGHRLRLVSLSENKVITLDNGRDFCKPAVTKDKKRAYVITLKEPHAVLFFDQASLWAPETLTRSINGFSGQIWAATLDDEDRYLYFRDSKGKLGRLDTTNPSNVEVLNEACGAADKDISYLAFNRVDQHFYMTVQNSQGIYRISKDGKIVEQYAGFNGVGNADGPRLDATMNNPVGLAFDNEGNLYCTESSGFVIRKIGLKDGYCVTVAGKYGKAGGEDGLPLASIFSYPYDITNDGEGNFYIVEGWGCLLRKFAIE